MTRRVQSPSQPTVLVSVPLKHRGGRGFSDTSVSGNLPEQYSNRRAQIHEETKT
jgi:hypothetical protein